MRREITASSRAPLKKHDAKKKPERFRIVSRVSPSTPLFMATLIEWKQNQSPTGNEPLLISVARASGSAVLRNRWKRLVKEWFYSEGLQTIPGQNIWIRYNRTKTLKKPLRYKEWASLLTAEALRLKAARV